VLAHKHTPIRKLEYADAMVTPPDRDRLPSRLEVTCHPFPDSKVPTPRAALVSCVRARLCVHSVGPLLPGLPGELREGFPLRLEPSVLCSSHGDT
jgi:hypothetical protein